MDNNNGNVDEDGAGPSTSDGAAAGAASAASASSSSTPQQQGPASFAAQVRSKHAKHMQRVAVGTHLEHQKLVVSLPEEGRLRAAKKEDFKKFRCALPEFSTAVDCFRSFARCSRWQ